MNENETTVSKQEKGSPEQSAAAADVQEQLRSLDEREAALDLRERQARMRAELRGRELPEELAECLDLSSDEQVDQTLETLSKLKQTLEQNDELLDLLHSLSSENVLSALHAFSDSADAQTLMKDLAENADALLPDLQKYVAFGKEYGLFTDAAEGMDLSLVFIYMTPSLHPAPAPAAEPATEKVPWYKKLFSK